MRLELLLAAAAATEAAGAGGEQRVLLAKGRRRGPAGEGARAPVAAVVAVAGCRDCSVVAGGSGDGCSYIRRQSFVVDPLYGVHVAYVNKGTNHLDKAYV